MKPDDFSVRTGANHTSGISCGAFFGKIPEDSLPGMSASFPGMPAFEELLELVSSPQRCAVEDKELWEEAGSALAKLLLRPLPSCNGLEARFEALMTPS